ncbi:MAG TPA: hypothetical protein VM618_04555 [Acidimicrobiia bacterium]|nr:hypothetical protein [Acidimicrobiia bacterium]
MPRTFTALALACGFVIGVGDPSLAVDVRPPTAEIDVVDERTFVGWGRDREPQADGSVIYTFAYFRIADRRPVGGHGGERTQSVEATIARRHCSGEA